MSHPVESIGHRRGSMFVPPGYQTVSTFREVIVPLVLVYAILLPAGLSLEIGSVVLPPYRIAILALLPFAIAKLAGRKLTAPDILIFAGSMWGMIAMFVNATFFEGLESGGSFVVDGFGSYLIGRAYLTDVRKLRSLLIYILPGVLVIAAILAIEAISHKLLIAPLFPQRASMQNLYETRLGLLRARAVFPHSIAAGMFMGSLLSLYVMSRVRPLTRNLGVLAAMTALFSGSSSAYVIIAMLIFLIGYKIVFNNLLGRKERLIYLLYAGAAIYVLLELITGRGAIRTLINLLALDANSGYYRLLIWEYGTASVAQDPWFGIGNAPMPRPRWMVMETIDNQWLALAVKHGLPTALLIGTGVVASIWLCISRNARLNDFDRSTTLGAVFALLALSVIAWTTGLWANHFAWYMLLLGAVTAMATQLPRRAQAAAPRHRPINRPPMVRPTAGVSPPGEEARGAARAQGPA